MVRRDMGRKFFTVFTSLIVFFFVTILPCGVNAGSIVKLWTEKQVYTQPEPIYVMIILSGLDTGYPVDISLGLRFPDGRITFMGVEAEFSMENPVYLVRAWPFSALSIQGETLPLRIAQNLQLYPGEYTLTAQIVDFQTGVLLDRSETRFTLVDAPYVERIEPTRGITGTMVQINGQGFGQDKDLVKVFIGQREATIMELTDTSIRTWVPYGATTGSVSVSVNGVASNELPFQVGPYIKSLSSEVLSPGDSLTIQGFNFDPDKNKNMVEFNGVRGTVTQASTTRLTVLVPAGNTGPLTVTANDMTSTPVDVTITPVVESIDPPRGEAGDVVTISGRNFSPTATNNYVVFNADGSDPFAAVVLEASTNQLVVRVPEAETGGVKVYTSGEEAQGGLSFTYPPEVDRVDPAIVVAGDTIAIYGRNFEDKEEKNVVLVGGSVLTIVSAKAHTITCKVPLNADSGGLKVVVNGMESKAGPFITVMSAPRITSVTPRELNATDTRTDIQVSGTGFVRGMTLTLKKNDASFNPTYTVSDYSSFTFRLPRGMTPGQYILRVKRSISGRELSSNEQTLIVR